jgi:hypothetical protein
MNMPLAAINATAGLNLVLIVMLLSMTALSMIKAGARAASNAGVRHKSAPRQACALWAAC